MSRTKQIREMCIAFLSNQEWATFHELRDHININTKHGTTSNQLSNILAKDKRFKQLDMITHYRLFTTPYNRVKLSGNTLNLSHKITTWTLSGVVE